MRIAVGSDEVTPLTDEILEAFLAERSESASTLAWLYFRAMRAVSASTQSAARERAEQLDVVAGPAQRLGDFVRQDRPLVRPQGDPHRVLLGCPSLVSQG